MIRALVFGFAAAIASPAVAQHEDHSTAPVDHTAMDHREGEPEGDYCVLTLETGNGQVETACQPPRSEQPVTTPPAFILAIPPPPESGPPPSAGSGPPRAADAIWGAERMRASREALLRDHGGATFLWIQADRLEYRAHAGDDGYLWDVQGWYGGDIDKLWLKSEGEGAWGDKPEGAEVRALWSHAIGPWFDLQAGVRQDLVGPSRTHAVVGVQGLAPYLFEFDAAAFLSIEGELTARIEAELDQRITQRLILQPRLELALSAQDIPELGVGAGFDHVEAGLRLRYEIVPEFAPYLGVEQEWKLGGSAHYARAEGDDPSVTSFVFGVRFWF